MEKTHLKYYALVTRGAEDYIVEGVFTTKHEARAAITEALRTYETEKAQGKKPKYPRYWILTKFATVTRATATSTQEPS